VEGQTKVFDKTREAKDIPYNIATSVAILGEENQWLSIFTAISFR